MICLWMGSSPQFAQCALNTHHSRLSPSTAMMNPPIDGGRPTEQRAGRRTWLLAGIGLILILVAIMRFATSPSPWIRTTLARELPVGTAVAEAQRVVEQRRWQHGELETVGEVSSLSAWIRDAYLDFSAGFPSTVDVIITFTFDRRGSLTRIEVTDRRLSI
jgi:hypothetical protein